MQTFVLEGTLRETLGRRASKDARASAMVPCILYGDGEKLEQKMEYAQRISSLVLSLRKKEKMANASGEGKVMVKKLNR